MPYIHTRVSTPISKEAEQTLAKALGKAIELIPGKSESWLMLDFEENCRLRFKGEEGAIAFVCVKLYGNAESSACQRFTQAVTRLLSDTLAIPPENVYIQYEPTAIWGWNGVNL